MRQAILGLVLAAALVTPAFAAPVSQAQQADFYKTCMAIAQNDRLCDCKAEAATKLVDAKFFGLVIAAMRGKAPPASANVAYNNYIARSNQICKPGY